MTRVLRASIGAFLLVTVVGLDTFSRVEASIVGVSVPVGSNDASSHPLDSGIWSVTASGGVLPITSGIGFLVNPSLTPGFSLHDHVYQSPNIPDPLRAVITYEFDTPTIVSGINIIQHTNGISKVEGFYGNSLGSMTSLGSVFGPSGDITGSFQFVEEESQVFDLGNTTQAGTFFQFIVRKTTLDTGWATYRAFLLDEHGTQISTVAAEVPEPGTFAMVFIGLTGLFYSTRVRRSGTHFG